MMYCRYIAVYTITVHIYKFITETVSTSVLLIVCMYEIILGKLAFLWQ